jgi:hypothetical protein
MIIICKSIRQTASIKEMAALPWICLPAHIAVQQESFMEAKNQQPCAHICLGSNTIGDVTFCTDCGVISVVLQYMTLRLEANAFLELDALLGSARARLLSLAQAQVDDLRPHSWQSESHVH